MCLMSHTSRDVGTSGRRDVGTWGCGDVPGYQEKNIPPTARRQASDSRFATKQNNKRNKNVRDDDLNIQTNKYAMIFLIFLIV